MRVQLSQIRINPVHDQIYTTNEIEDLVESMGKNGLLEPLIITPDKIIISGHRRYLAAKSLGWEEIEVNIREVDESNMEYTIVSANQHRRKKSAEVLNEIQRLYQNYARSQGPGKVPSYPVQPGQESDRQTESWYW
jgi:ParB family transcriptional regulator, chromosome partitioning protein